MKKLLCFIFLIAMAAGLTGCSEQKEEITVRYLNFKPEVSDVWREVAKLYKEETGITVEILDSPSNCNEQTLKAEIAKKEAPTLFQINGPVGYEAWKYYCADLTDTDLYSWVADKSMVITGDDGRVYAIPYVVEGYGIIYNDAIMQKYFSLKTKSVNVSSMDEINTFQVFKTVVEDMTQHRSELGIEGVFASTSFAKGEEWRWQTHLMNLPIYYEYKDKGINDTNELDFSYGENFKNIFDLYLDNSVVEKSDVATKTVNDSMTEFALGKCAMVQNGNWAWSQISNTSGNVVSEKDCKFFPIYVGASGEERQGLCIGTECYICVNNMADEATQQAAIDFLEWLFSSDLGKDYVTNKFEFISVFNTFSEDEAPSNPLAKEVRSYINDSSKDTVSWNFTTFPGQSFKDNLADELYKYIKEEISFEEISLFVKTNWKAEKSTE